MDYKTTSIVQLVRLYNYGIQPRSVYEGLHAVFMYVHLGVYMIDLYSSNTAMHAYTIT